jgi:2-dehydropantoate 2-reductase
VPRATSPCIHRRLPIRDNWRQPDLIILAVKAYDLDEVMAQLEPVMTERTVMLTLQNGIDTEDRIIARVHRDSVVGGVAFIYSKIVEPGVIEHYKRGGVAIGELMGHKSERVLQIAEIFKQAGISCQLSDDIRKSKWEKMCWNCVFNPLTVLIDDKVAKALDHPEMAGVIRQIVGEVMAVSAAVKVPLAPDMAEKVVKWTQELRDIHTSMYDDWKAKRPTEIDYLNGYIVRMGRELGIPTPVNEALTAMVKAITEREPCWSRCRPDRWRGRPTGFSYASGAGATAASTTCRRYQSADAVDARPGHSRQWPVGYSSPCGRCRPCHVPFRGWEVRGDAHPAAGARFRTAALRTRRPAPTGRQGRSLPPGDAGPG